MTLHQMIIHIEDVAAAYTTGFVLGKLTADPSTVSVDELCRIDTRFIESR